jgi:hypothetical protein
MPAVFPPQKLSRPQTSGKLPIPNKREEIKNPKTWHIYPPSFLYLKQREIYKKAARCIPLAETVRVAHSRALSAREWERKLTKVYGILSETTQTPG